MVFGRRGSRRTTLWWLATALLAGAVLVGAVLVGAVLAARTRDDPRVVACVDHVQYWVRDHPDVGLDYQEMGVSSHTYDAIRAVRLWRRTHAPDDPGLMEQARLECRVGYADATDDQAPGWP